MSTQILRPTEVSQMLGVHLSTLYRMEKRGDLPARIQISERAVGWLRSDVEEYVQSRRKEQQ